MQRPSFFEKSIMLGKEEKRMTSSKVDGLDYNFKKYATEILQSPD